jgi:branched-chain amino acid transport system substrate-binding protein
MHRRAFLAATGLAFVSAGCGSGSSGSGSSSPIKIGASLPLTGPVADVAKPGYQGYQAWRKKINDAGGLLGRHVEFVVYDDQFDQNTVVANYNRLISQDKVDLLIGTFSSFLNLPASAVAERNGMVYIEPSGGADEIFTRGFTRLFFAQPGTTPSVPDRFVEYLTSLPSGERPKTAAYPTQNDPSADVPVKVFRLRLEALGIRTVYSADYPPDTTNFDALANAIRQANPDLVIHGALEPDGIALVQSFQKVGFSPAMFFQTQAPTGVKTYPAGIGAANTQGIFTAGTWHPKADYRGNAEFVSAYKAQFGEEPSEDAANSFTAAQVLQAAVESVGRIDQGAIANWLHGNAVETIVGSLKWDERGVPNGSLLLMQWQNGALEVVAPATAATSTTVIRPKPAWAS